MDKIVKSMKTILIADEDNAVRKSVSALFSALGYRVVSVSGGADAISKSKEMKPDIVLVDVSLSNGEGYEVSERIKDDPTLQDTPVVLLVSSLGVFDEVKAAEVRADDFMIKPLRSDKIIKKVESFINRREGVKIKYAFNFLPHAKEAIIEEPHEFQMFNEGTIHGDEPEDRGSYGKAGYNNGAEKIKIGREASESDEEIILLEEELIEHASNAESNAKKIDTLAEKSKTEIVDKVSQMVMKRLSEVIPESISKVVDSVLKEEIKKIKEDE